MKHSYIAMLIILATLQIAVPLQAQEASPVFETVVEDVIFNTSSRVILDEKLIQDSKAPDLTTLLSSQANITISNRPYQPNSVFIRGSDASHILILVDGIPFYDAATTQRTLNLNSMDVKSIRRVEIIKGAQTTLYGGQALGGVIKIETLPASLEPKSQLQARAGQFDLSEAAVGTFIPTLENQGAYLRAQAGQFRTESPVLSSTKMYSHAKGNGEAAYLWRGPVHAYLKAHYIKEENESANADRNTNLIIDADDLKQKSQQLALHSLIKLQDLPWSPQLILGAQSSNREFDQPINSTNPTQQVEQDYGANLRTARLDFTPWKSELLEAHWGASYVHEDFVYRNLGVENSNNFSEQRGLFAKFDYQVLPSLQFAVGGRIEDWGDKEAVSTYQLGVTLFQNTKLEFATGYKVPSLFQLYSSYGNPNLNEEKSTQYSLTQDFPISDSQSLSLTAFSTEFSDLIVVQGLPPNSRYENVSKSKTNGVELAYSLKPATGSSLLFTYGYQEPKDISANRWLPLRSLVNGSVRFTQDWEFHTVSFEVLAAGERLDRVSPTAYGSLPGYATSNMAYTFKWDQNLSLYTRLNNLMNTRYQESNGYYSQSFNAYAGADYQF